MKTYSLMFLLAFLFCATSYAQKITTLVGRIQDGKPILTIDKDNILKVYNAKLFKYSGIDGKFSDIEIKSVEGSGYALVFSGPFYKSAFFVQSEGNELRALASTSCTTSDCSSEPLGCVVKYDGGDFGYCSPCANAGKCTKTSTSESMLE